MFSNKTLSMLWLFQNLLKKKQTNLKFGLLFSKNTDQNLNLMMDSSVIILNWCK